MKDAIPIKRRKKARGEDGYKTFSVRIREETATALDRIAWESNHTRNELINMVLEYAVEHHEIIE